MADERTVLDNLVEGRDALRREVDRLSAAITELDSVLSRIGSLSGAASALSGPPAPAPAEDASAEEDEPEPSPVEPVNPRAEVEPTPAVPSRPRAAARKAPAKKVARPARRQGEAPKSIRVHVLDMLAAESRDVGLAEIIDNVHQAGIQAHDDAVRSITIKLMKDGKVERVGRGRYRLARRGSAARASAAVATAPRVTEPAPEPAAATEPDVSPEVDGAAAAAPVTPDAVDTAETPATPDVVAHPVEQAEPPAAGFVPAAAPAPWGGETAPAAEAPDAVSETAVDEPAEQAAPPAPEQDDRGYTPPLNLGQPWR